MYVGPQHIPPTDDEATNPKYNTISDKRSKQPVNEPVGYYAEVIIPTADDTKPSLCCVMSIFLLFTFVFF